MSFVFVVDHQRKPLDPVHPGRARFLLQTGHAAVLRRFPFTIILKATKPDRVSTPLRFKIDPGSQTSGLAVVNDTTGQVVWAAELVHRAHKVKEHLDKRRSHRRFRRQRHTRYRQPRFLNRRRKPGWLPPSLESRLQNILTWVARVRQYCPVGSLSQEMVRFDMQALEHPEIEGIQYQQGTLAGYELREYLLLKWNHRCAYCGKTALPLQIEHLIPKARGGSNRVVNLAIACQACNQKKGSQTATEFGYPQLERQAHQTFKDAAAVNSSRWVLYERLGALDLPLEIGTGGRTKYNRLVRGIPKTHWLDAACVGESTPEELCWLPVIPLRIRATGRHSRQMCRTNTSGFPNKAPKGTSMVGGFRSGDIVRAVMPASSKKAGTYIGRIAIRSNGFCNLQTKQATLQGIHVRYCRPLHRADGYSYQKGVCASSPSSRPGFSRTMFDESL